ncbi:MAG: hypothetical protein V3T77_02630, partial [Planctomycetota bacterium]
MTEPQDTLRKALFQGVRELEAEDLLLLLPHRPPILMLDRVISLVPRRHAVGLKMVTGNEFGLSTKEHGFIFPATLALEALVQLATVTLRYPEDGVWPEKGMEDSVFLAGIEQLTVHRELLSGEALQLSVTIQDPDPTPVSVDGQVVLGGEAYV